MFSLCRVSSSVGEDQLTLELLSGYRKERRPLEKRSGNPERKLVKYIFKTFLHQRMRQSDHKFRCKLTIITITNHFAYISDMLSPCTSKSFININFKKGRLLMLLNMCIYLRKHKASIITEVLLWEVKSN